MLGETGDWTGALTRITTMIQGGQDPVEGLAHGFASGGLVEAYARQIEQDKGVELGMALPVLLAALSGATQGAFTVPMLQSGGGENYDWTPLIVQFIGIAEAGQSKSTLLKEVSGPLRYALDRKGLDHRRKLVADARAAAKKAHDAIVGLDYEENVLHKVYNGGLCPTSVTDQGTQEGIRKALATNGGHRVILTAEPDVLAEISQYQQKGGAGSVGLMLRGWGQEELNVDRAGDGNSQSAKAPSLPFVILTQPESFNEYTGGGQPRDRFVDRGVFSRTLLCRAERTPVVDPFDEAWIEALTSDDAVDTGLMGSPLLAMREDLEKVLDRLVERTNAYRVAQGIETAWNAHVSLFDWILRPIEVKQIKIPLYKKGDKAGRLAALKVMVRLQKLRVAIRSAVADAEAVNSGIASLLDPLAIRYTDHVMRIAALMSLAENPNATVVDTEMIEDVATRIMPWLWAQWWKVMTDRMEASGRTYVENQTLRNPKKIDLSGGARLLAAMAKLEAKQSGQVGLIEISEGLRPRDIFRQASIGMESRSGNNPYFRKELDVLVAEGLVEKVKDTSNASDTIKSANYRLTAAGRTEAAVHAG